MTVWSMVVPRRQADAAFAFTRARALGVQVATSEVSCKTVDALPLPGGQLGVFRKIGSVRFSKKHRQWTAYLRGDCTATETVTLLAAACDLAQRHGRSPGHGLRGREWRHWTTKSGDPSASASVCYKLSAEDLLATSQEAVDVPDTIESLTLQLNDEIGLIA